MQQQQEEEEEEEDAGSRTLFHLGPQATGAGPTHRWLF